jgi:hypothetical protein
MESAEVASVSPKGLLTGLKLGDTTVYATLKHPDLEALVQWQPIESLGLRCAATVAVEFEAFVVRAPSRHLLQGRGTNLFLEGTNGEVRVYVCRWLTCLPRGDFVDDGYVNAATRTNN